MFVCFLLVGCTDTKKDKEEVSTVPDDELYDIYYIKEAPKATETYDLSEVIKVVLTKNEELMDETIAIDVEKSGIYMDPSLQSLGVRASKGMQDIDDVQEVLDILEKYQVQDWKEDYSQEGDPSTTDDGVGWSLYIQYKDGTMQQHIGSGTSMKSVTPEGFDEFFLELNSFVEERLDGSTVTDDNLYDIYFIKKAPKATEMHDLSEAIKVVFTYSDSSVGDTIAIDIQEGIIHIEPWVSTLGVTSLDESEHINDIDVVIDLLREYNVQGWKDDYTYEDPSTYEDGFGWNLWIQFEDGTVEKHGGSGSFAEEITPDGFDEFVGALNDFVNSRLEDEQ